MVYLIKLECVVLNSLHNFMSAGGIAPGGQRYIPPHLRGQAGVLPTPNLSQPPPSGPPPQQGGWGGPPPQGAGRGGRDFGPPRNDRWGGGIKEVP